MVTAAYNTQFSNEITRSDNDVGTIWLPVDNSEIQLFCAHVINEIMSTSDGLV